MQKQMDLFGVSLPETVQHRVNYGLQLFYLGQVMAGQARQRPGVNEDSDSPANPEEAKRAVGLVEMVYHGIHNLDVSAKVQAPHEMLLVMNTSQILQLYAGAWLLKMDSGKWARATSGHTFGQVVGAARRAVRENPMNRYLLIRLDALCGKTYAADEDGSLPMRLKQLPQSVADQFMNAFTFPFRSPNERAGYAAVSRLKKRLDDVVFGHFAHKFAEGERQLSIGAS